MVTLAKIFRCVVPLFVFAAAANAEFREFTNEQGQTIEAELVELTDEGTVVTIRLRNGATVDADLTAFSGDDQTFIRDWWKSVEADKLLLTPESRIKASIKLNRKKKSDSGWSAYWTSLDDETIGYFPQVVVENEDSVRTFKGNTVRGVVIAHDKEDEDTLLVASAFDLKADFKRYDTTLLDGVPFRLREVEYKDTYGTAYGYERGYEYEGYVVVIKNSKGEVVYSKASKSKYLTRMENVMGCRMGDLYDGDFNRKLSEKASSYYSK